MINVVRDTHTLLRSSGELQPGRGVTTVIALGLGALSLLGVLVFHYPQYLTTPDLRPKYPVELLRFVLLGALLVAGLARLLGAAGIGVGALILLLIGNPLSGIATSPRFLPAPWGSLGQWLPTGAGGTLLRTVSYFPEASVAWPMTILLGWALLGALGVIFGRAAIGHGSGAAEIAVETPGRHEAITV